MDRRAQVELKWERVQAPGDGFCPQLSRHNPKLGHVKNCSMSMRREPHGRGLHSSTFQLNVSAFVWDKGCVWEAFRGYPGGARGYLGVWVCFRVRNG